MKFKNKKDYLEQRTNLINEANKANENGELDKASELVAKIKNLDNDSTLRLFYQLIGK